MDIGRIQRILFIVILLILTFDQHYIKKDIKALQNAPQSTNQSCEEQVKKLNARLEYTEKKTDIAIDMAQFSKTQSFEAKQWVIEEMHKRNVAEEKHINPTGTTYKSFMGGK